ncbi:MAG: thioesterase [Ferruginibacter sp.]|nr:thioesterase [Ferruginibacter sp.]
MSKINLLCLPFSGGSKYSFSGLFNSASGVYSPVVLELPGRGKRTQESLLYNIDQAEIDLFQQAQPYLDKPYAVYGHSLGGLLAFRLIKHIQQGGLKKPLHLFATGASAPSVPFKKSYHLLGKQQFIDKIKSLKGMPEEIMENEEIMNYFEPIIRADFTLLETYNYEPSPPFDIPVTVIFGDREDMQIEEVEPWKNETTGDIDIRQMPGGHFFIYNHAIKIQKIIEDKIAAARPMLAAGS